MSESTANPIGIEDFLHFSVTVSKIERSIAFYRDILGFDVLTPPGQEASTPIREEDARSGSYVGAVTGYENARLRIAMLRRGTAMLELIEYCEPTGEAHAPGTHRPGSPHMALSVRDLTAAWEHLQHIAAEWNLSFTSAGPVEVISGPSRGGKAVYFRDPDGITIELVQMSQT
jgi:catechol 2,3-dioxygenase-like lactoylglutathione lyase family enzyme